MMKVRIHQEACMQKQEVFLSKLKAEVNNTKIMIMPIQAYFLLLRNFTVLFQFPVLR